MQKVKKKSRWRGVLFPQTPLEVDEKRGGAFGLPFRGLSHSHACAGFLLLQKGCRYLPFADGQVKPH